MENKLRAQLLQHLYHCFCMVYEYDRMCAEINAKGHEHRAVDLARDALLQDITDHIYVLKEMGYSINEGQLAQVLTHGKNDADKVCIGIALWKDQLQQYVNTKWNK